MGKNGFFKTTYNNIKQILFDTKNQTAVGCIVPQSMAGADGWVKQGTPINIDLSNINNPVTAPVAGGSGVTAVPMNAILLHDVYVGTESGATGNGTALIFGFVNLNRLSSTIQSAIATAKAITGSTNLITFAKV